MKISTSGDTLSKESDTGGQLLPPPLRRVFAIQPDFIVFRVTTLHAPTGRALRPIHGTKGQTLPAWLEPHREKFIHFVNVAFRFGWPVSEPHWQRCHVRLGEKGVVLVFKGGHELPQNADRLTRGQRMYFWRIVQEWVALEKANRDKSTESGRSNRNVNCVNRDGTAELNSNNSRTR